MIGKPEAPASSPNIQLARSFSPLQNRANQLFCYGSHEGLFWIKFGIQQRIFELGRRMAPHRKYSLAVDVVTDCFGYPQRNFEILPAW